MDIDLTAYCSECLQPYKEGMTIMNIDNLEQYCSYCKKITMLNKPGYWNDEEGD